MGVNFPSRPPNGQKFPDPALPDLPVWQWNGTAWVQISGGSGGGSGAASGITFAPGGNISATDVQTAILELDTEKAPLASPVFTGDPKAPTPTAGDNDTSIATTAFVAAAVTTAGSAAQVIRYDIAQTLTSAQQAQARANIGSLKKNYVLNGAMQISQENGATQGAMTGVAYYAVDMFNCSASGTTGAPVAQQVASVTPGGSPSRLSIGPTVVDAAVAAGDVVYIDQYIEGLRVADLRFGSTSAKTVTIQFGVRAPAGTYCVTLMNGAQNRSYVSEYVIAAGEANTDVVKSVVVPGDIAGAWVSDNTRNITIRWGLMAGTTYQAAAGSWSTTNAVGSANQFNLMGGANTFQLFDVGLYEGAAAPTFQVPDYASELALCKRYWCKIKYGAGAAYSTTAVRMFVQFGEMRTIPVASIASPLTITDIFTASPTQSIASIINPNFGVDIGQLDFDSFTGLTTGRFYTIHGSSPYLRLNARL